MHLSFSSREVRFACDEPNRAGLSQWEVSELTRTLADLRAAETFLDIPGWYGDLTAGAGRTVKLRAGDSIQLLCRIDHAPVRLNSDDAIDWAATTRLQIVAIERNGDTL
jgi:hypothetical protein